MHQPPRSEPSTEPSTGPSSRRARRAAGRRRRVRALWKLPRTRRWILWGLAGLVVLGIAFGLWMIGPYWEATAQFSEHPLVQPSRLYGQPQRLEVGQRVSLDSLVGGLALEGYRALEEGERFSPGRFRQGEGSLEVFLRTFPTPTGVVGGGRPLAIELTGSRITGLSLGEEPVEAAVLEPPLIATFYGDDRKERRPVSVDELPEELVQAVLAAEDSEFFSHPGLSITGILRAFWVNLREGEVSQGGSTLTQQLVKNIYLTHERTFSRKIREAGLSVILELRFSKREILEAYLNEIYLGSADGVSLMGFGAASRAYFGKDPAFLDLAESATLAGIIRSPANYSPLTAPEKARERRDLILGRLEELEWIDPERIARARAQPVRVAPAPVARRRAPYFADAMAVEAAERFGVGALEDTGYTLLSTLDLQEQRLAEEAITWGMEALETGWEKGRELEGPLQGALVSVNPVDGSVRAWVGGRDYAASQFDRVSQAHRQAGSAFKPMVFAAAFEHGVATPATPLEDEPFTYRQAGQRWEPSNYDGQYRGWVTLRRAAEQSLNVPTARLALATGLPQIIDTARAMGVTAPLDPVPALALGAFELTPVEMAAVYSTLARGGTTTTVHGLFGVLDREGAMVAGSDLPEPRRALSPETAFLVTSLLQGVVERGTGSGLRSQGLQGPIAGKTGTSNERRDSWFAGYSTDRVTVVWVGYDNNDTTRMSGARAAVPIWGRFVSKIRPRGGFEEFPMPAGVTTATIDPETGDLATDDCPYVRLEVFPVGRVPQQRCEKHRSFWDWGDDRAWDDAWRDRRGEGQVGESRGEEGELEDPERGDARQEEEDGRSRFRRWIDRVFGEEGGGEGGDDGSGDGGYRAPEPQAWRSQERPRVRPRAQADPGPRPSVRAPEEERLGLRPARPAPGNEPRLGLADPAGLEQPLEARPEPSGETGSLAGGAPEPRPFEVVRRRPAASPPPTEPPATVPPGR